MDASHCISMEKFCQCYGRRCRNNDVVLKSLNSIERIQPWMMVAIFNGNHRATIIYCCIPTNIGEETELITFYNGLSYLVLSIPKQNVLVIGGDMNAQIARHTLFRGCVLRPLNFHGKNTTEPTKKHHTNNDHQTLWLGPSYMLALRNKFDVLQEKTEIRTPNDEYENFVNAHLEAAAKCILSRDILLRRWKWDDCYPLVWINSNLTWVTSSSPNKIAWPWGGRKVEAKRLAGTLKRKWGLPPVSGNRKEKS